MRCGIPWALLGKIFNLETTVPFYSEGVAPGSVGERGVQETLQTFAYGRQLP